MLTYLFVTLDSIIGGFEYLTVCVTKITDWPTGIFFINKTHQNVIVNCVDSVAEPVIYNHREPLVMYDILNKWTWYEKQ